MDIYFSGKKLYGDDFTIEQIEQWYLDEKEGYSSLVEKKTSYTYSYHRSNQYYGFKYLKGQHFKSALGFGSAYGDEFKPIASQIDKLTIIDPSDRFKKTTIHGIPTDYIQPNTNGLLDFEDNSFDLITCLGVLHHIPNVTTVVQELHRCLTDGGFALIREPIVSMGDWRYQRGNLTKRERGIPYDIFREIIQSSGFEIVKESFCMCPLIARLWGKMNRYAYNSHIGTWLDAQLCYLLKWNKRYHPQNTIQKIKPASIYYVLSKPTHPS